MNKLATISLVTVLGIAGGGAYMAMNPDKASEFAQYIPEPVTGLMNEYIPEEYKPAFLTQNSVIETEGFVEEQAVEPQQEESIFQESQQAVEMSNNGQQVSNEQEILDESMQEIQDALGEELAVETPESTQAVAAVEEPLSSDPKAAKIEKKINGINVEISKLDSENEDLKNRFQQILKKNRELAEQLKEIDEKLTAAN